MVNNNSGDMVHVNNYTRGDGTHVDDYYRAKPGGGSLVGNNSSNNIDVPNTVSNVLNTVGDGKSFEDECPALAKLFGSASKNKMNGVEEVPEVILKGGVTFIRIVLEKAVKVAKVAIEAIVVAAPVVAALYGAYKTGKAVYDNVSNFFSSKEAKTQVKTVNVAIQGLRETQGLQKKNIDFLVKQSASAKNQEEYSKLYEELEKQKAQYDKNNALLDKIEYSAQQQDYESVANGLDEYMNNMNQIIDDSSSTQEGSVEKNDLSAFDTSYFEQDLPYQFENSHKSFDDVHKETYLTDELMNNLLGIQPASAEECVTQSQRTYDNASANNTSYVDNNEFSTLKGEVSKNVEEIGELIKPIIRKAVNGSVLSILDTKMGKIALDLINQLLNAKAKDAADLMQISLYGPQNLEPTTDYTPISKDFNEKTSKALGITGTDIEIPKDWNGVVFENDSHLAQSLNNSNQYKEIFKLYFTDDNKNLGVITGGTFEIYPKSYGFKINISKAQDANLFKSIHNGTIVNPKMENGYFTGILYDKYDFELNLEKYMEKGQFKNTVINNLAYYLQGTGILNNYYLIVPIKIKL